MHEMAIYLFYLCHFTHSPGQASPDPIYAMSFVSSKRMRKSKLEWRLSPAQYSSTTTTKKNHDHKKRGVESIMRNETEIE